MTPPARDFWLAVLIVELPEITRQDVAVAFESAAQLALPGTRRGEQRPAG